jgi:formylmethanofuran dehydrogenase subunit E
VGEPGVRAECASCGEEIINRREVHVAGQTMCASCAGGAYYVMPRQVRSRQTRGG